jgi:predicted aldo/keto reductase-like oxidoreductase
MSLKELKTDYLDIWYLHGKDAPQAIKEELAEAQEIARKQGKTRFTGISTHKVAAVSDAVIMNGKLDVVLAVYNFTMDPATSAAIDSLAQAGVGVAAMKVMAGGLRGRNPRPQMKRPGAMTAALRWVLKNPKVATTIPSMTDMDQLDQNLKAMTEGFTVEDEKVLAGHLEQIRPWFCRMCGQCDAKCPQGLPVSNLVRYAMYADGYGQFSLGRERFLELPQAVRDVRCQACPACTIECPNGVHVAERLTRAQELFA